VWVQDLMYKSLQQERKKNGSSAPLGRARQPRRIGLGHTPGPPSSCCVLLLLALGWAARLLHLIVLDWDCTSPPLPFRVGLGCMPPPPRHCVELGCTAIDAIFMYQSRVMPKSLHTSIWAKPHQPKKSHPAMMPVMVRISNRVL